MGTSAVIINTANNGAAASGRTATKTMLNSSTVNASFPNSPTQAARNSALAFGRARDIASLAARNAFGSVAIRHPSSAEYP